MHVYLRFVDFSLETSVETSVQAPFEAPVHPGYDERKGVMA